MWQVAQDADETLLVCLELLPDRLACSALAEMKSAAAPAVPALVELLESNPGKAVGVVKALGEIGPAAESALPALDALAANPMWGYRHLARKAASQIRGTEPAEK
jgi:hypothetical protein